MPCARGIPENVSLHDARANLEGWAPLLRRVTLASEFPTNNTSGDIFYIFSHSALAANHTGPARLASAKAPHYRRWRRDTSRESRPSISQRLWHLSYSDPDEDPDVCACGTEISREFNFRVRARGDVRFIPIHYAPCPILSSLDIPVININGVVLALAKEPSSY